MIRSEQLTLSLNGNNDLCRRLIREKHAKKRGSGTPVTVSERGETSKHAQQQMFFLTQLRDATTGTSLPLRYSSTPTYAGMLYTREVSLFSHRSIHLIKPHATLSGWLVSYIIKYVLTPWSRQVSLTWFVGAKGHDGG
ncbi:hypothetical protein RRG08_052440 [Elysia crispata]|uniref:Uncharacterized protein n=1 Tax=Elysia crispata TaxID=231223 RepID=A0AAE1B2T3_9GAST|nr:hypothetical protein RRG08_052440 [Elysia crispata]